MQAGALSADGDGQSISGAAGKDNEHGISNGGYKTRSRKRGVTIPNNPDSLSRPPGAECGDTEKNWEVLEEEGNNDETMAEGE